MGDLGVLKKGIDMKYKLCLSVLGRIFLERESQSKEATEAILDNPGESSLCVVDPDIGAAHFTYCLSALCMRSLSP